LFANGDASEGIKLKESNAQIIKNAITAHPLFIASLFVLHIYRQLTPFSSLKELIRDLIAVLVGVLVVQFAFARLFRQPFKAALATSLSVVLSCLS
jgi:FlaA1/EpsC-like NDP-sugar epimerase